MSRLQVDFSQGWLKSITSLATLSQEGVFCVSQKTLPVCFRDIDFPMMHYYGDPWELFFITSYKLVVNEETVSQSASRGTLDIQSRPLYTLNEFLRIEYSRQLGSGIKVHTTEYPIFKSCNPFSKDELNKLFNKFIKNNQDLLRSQYKVTKNKCHIRAHFINYCLREYGIDSYKIFKFWEVDDWQLYEDNKSWTFHCAALIRDNEGNDWIWDPWEASATELVSLRDWTIRTGQPIPKAVMITPGFMACFPYCPITTKTTCATIPSSRYPLISTDEMKENPNDLRAFQAMHASVVRLPIEKNFGNPYRLFQPEPRELKLLKYSPAMTESSCPEHSTASCSRP